MDLVADLITAVFGNDHGPVIEIADGLTGVLAGFEQMNHHLITDHNGGAKCHGELMQSGSTPKPEPVVAAEPNPAVAAFFDSIDQRANTPEGPSTMSSPVPPTPD